MPKPKLSVEFIRGVKYTIRTIKRVLPFYDTQHASEDLMYVLDAIEQEIKEKK